MVIPHQQHPFTENTNGAGEDLYLSWGTRRRTTTGEDELGAGTEKKEQTGRRKKAQGGNGEKNPNLK